MSIFEGDLLGKWSDTYQEGCSFYIKSKLKSEIFNDKKVYKQKHFPCHNYAFKLRILTKNLVTFKRWDGD